ncbi:MAG: relaxase domain-containing protein [Selenomonadaceae bacterium]|nr:relaxase domain-containing protein [Selenomonadaceae bacterium]
MLSISKCVVEMAMNYYGKDDYYADDAKESDVWQGRLAEELGLDGKTVNKEIFEAMLKESGEKIAAFDLTFSAPKSVSIIALIGDEKQRNLIREAHEKSVYDTLMEIEKNEIYTRTKKDGKLKIHQTKKMLVAKFRHYLSRAEDPELHTHCVVMNKTVFDGKQYTLFGKKLYNVKMIYGAEYRARLAVELQRLGYKISITDKEKGLFEIAGFKDEVLRKFSKRRAEIESYLEENNLSGSQAAEQATLKTRRAKNHDVDIIAKREEIKNKLVELNQELPKPKKENKQVFTIIEKNQSYNEAVELMQYKKFAWTQKEFEEKIIQNGVAFGITREEAKCFIQEDNSILRAVYAKTGEIFYTTEHNIKQAQNIFEEVENGVMNWHYSVEKNIIEDNINTIEKERTITLTLEQKALVKHIAESKNQIIAVRGLAGTGKTFSLDITRELMESQGFNVYGMSMSGHAAEELKKDAHLKHCSTIHHELNNAEKSAGNKIDGEDYSQKNKWNFNGLKKSDKPTIWLMDEAGLTDNNTLAHALEMIRLRGDKLVLIGDDKQLPPVGVGNAFAELIQQQKISTVFLDNIRRQEDKKLLEAVKEIVGGKVEKSLEILSPNITEIKKSTDRLNAVAESYTALADKERAETIILTARNSERMNINIKVRENLIQQSKLKEGEEFSISIKNKTETRNFAQGDIILFLKNDHKLGVMNGTRGKIKSINDKIFQIVTVEGKTVYIDINRYNSIDYGYAITTHKAQGMTIKRAMINLDSNATKLNNRNAFYVDISRAKSDIQIFCDDKEKLSKQIAKFVEKYSVKDFDFVKAPRNAYKFHYKRDSKIKK